MIANISISLAEILQNGFRCQQLVTSFVGISAARVDQIMQKHMKFFHSFMLAVRSSEIHLTGPTENLSLEKVAQVVASLDVFAEKIIEKRNAVALIDEDLNRNAYPTLFTDSMFCQIRNIDREIFLAYIRMYEICRKAGIGVGFWVL